MSALSTNPQGLAAAALERARAAVLGVPTSPVIISIDTVPLHDGRVRLVDHQTRQVLGTAVNSAQAQRTREFFR